MHRAGILAAAAKRGKPNPVSYLTSSQDQAREIGEECRSELERLGCKVLVTHETTETGEHRVSVHHEAADDGSRAGEHDAGRAHDGEAERQAPPRAGQERRLDVARDAWCLAEDIPMTLDERLLHVIQAVDAYDEHRAAEP